MSFSSSRQKKNQEECISNDSFTEYESVSASSFDQKNQKNQDELISDGYSYHAGILHCLQSLGYPIQKRGACLGIGLMATQAIFSNDIETFNARLRQISLLDQKLFHIKKELLAEVGVQLSFSDRIKSIFEILAASKKCKTLSSNQGIVKDLTETFTQKVQKLKSKFPDKINLLAFLDGIIIYQDPPSDFFEEKVRPDILDSMPFALNKWLEKSKGFTDVTQFSGIYTTPELMNYLTTLRHSLSSGTDTVTLLLDSHNHAIYVGYNPQEDIWIFCDANQLPLKKITEDKEIANKIMQAFHTSEIAAFSTTIYALKDHALSPLIQQWQTQKIWKDLHEVTTEKAKQTDSQGCSWLYLVATNSEKENSQSIQTVNSLLSCRANPNPIVKNTSFPTILAETAMMRKYIIAGLLLKHGSIPDAAAAFHLQKKYSEEYLKSFGFSAKRETIRTQISAIKSIPGIPNHEKVLNQLLKMCYEIKDITIVETYFNAFQKFNSLVRDIYNLASSLPEHHKKFQDIINQGYDRLMNLEEKEDNTCALEDFMSNIDDFCQHQLTKKFGLFIKLFDCFQKTPLKEIQQLVKNPTKDKNLQKDCKPKS